MCFAPPWRTAFVTSSRTMWMMACADFSVKALRGAENRTESSASPTCGASAILSASSIVALSSALFLRSCRTFLSSLRHELTVRDAMSRWMRASSGIDSLSASIALSSIEMPVRFCEIASCSSVARLVRSRYLSSERTLSIRSSASLRPRSSERRLSVRFQMRTAMTMKTSRQTSARSRRGVHHDGRERTRMSDGERTTRKNPFMRGKIEF